MPVPSKDCDGCLPFVSCVWAFNFDFIFELSLEIGIFAILLYSDIEYTNSTSKYVQKLFLFVMKLNFICSLFYVP